MPVHLDIDSLTVRVDGPDGMLVGSIETRLVRGSDLIHPDALVLQERIVAVQNDRQALQYQLRIQIALARSLVDGAGGSGLHPDLWSEAFSIIGKDDEQVYSQCHKIEIELQVVDDELAQLRHQLCDLGSEHRDTLEAVIG